MQETAPLTEALVGSPLIPRTVNNYHSFMDKRTTLEEILAMFYLLFQCVAQEPEHLSHSGTIVATILGIIHKLRLLDDTANESEQDVLLKVTQLARLHHSLQARHPGSSSSSKLLVKMYQMDQLLMTSQICTYSQSLSALGCLHFGFGVCLSLEYNTLT